MSNQTELPGVDYKEKVRKSVYDDASFSLPFVIMNVLAAVVASYGLLADSTAVVIGAMVISPLLGPIVGIALGLLESHAPLLRRALLSEAIGVVLVLGVSLLVGWLYRDIPPGNEILSRTSPTTFDLAIALAGGAAGAYATTSPRLSVGLVGVAVAIALVPPLSAAGILLARGAYSLAGGALLLFLTNLVAIQCAASLVLFLMGYARLTQRSREWQKIALRNGLSIALLLILAVALGLNLKQNVDRILYESKIRSQLTQAMGVYPGAYLAETRFEYEGQTTLVIAVVRTPATFAPRQVAELETHLSPPSNGSLDLHVRSVITTETTPHGTVYPTSP